MNGMAVTDKILYFKGEFCNPFLNNMAKLQRMLFYLWKGNLFNSKKVSKEGYFFLKEVSNHKFSLKTAKIDRIEAGRPFVII